MHLFRGRIFTPLADPFSAEDPGGSYRYFEDGYLAFDDGDGTITGIGDWSALPQKLQEVDAVRLDSGKLIAPGFVDTHLHAPQLEMIGSYGGHLLEWLNRYTFPTEGKFSDATHAGRVATALFDELLKNGTLTALIFSTIHARATALFFEEAERRGFRAIIGKTMMDRNSPDYLTEDAETSYRESRDLLLEWHGRGMLRYAITPRFAPTSTSRLLELAGELKKSFPEVYVHSHVSENITEVAWVRELFPDQKSYVDVYDHFGLLDSRTVLAHGVHLTDEELATLSERGSRLSHCPDSNLFLGSGLFPLKRVLKAGVGVGLGTDIGGGTTPSMFDAMAGAYKVQQVQNVSLSPFELWYLATLGGARALSFDQVTGSLEEGKDADFLILDLNATTLLSRRTACARSIEDLLAGLIFMGDDRVVLRAYIRGREVRSREE